MDNSAFNDPKLDPDQCEAMSAIIDYDDYDYWGEDNVSIVVEDKAKERVIHVKEETLSRKSNSEQTVLESNEIDKVLRKVSPKKSEDNVHLRDNLTYFEKSDRCRKRFKNVKKIGRGSRGTVFKAYDTFFKKNVALKVVEREEVSSMREALALGLISSQDPPRKHLMKRIELIHVEDYTLMVLELLHCDLATAMKTKFRRGMKLKQIASIGLQLCHAICNMQDLKYPATIFHNGIKTDTVMFTDNSYSKIKIADFRFAAFTFVKEMFPIQTFYTKAPECYFLDNFIVGQSVDMWNVGVVLFTLFQGQDMFPSKSEMEHIANIVLTFGMPPMKMLESPISENYFECLDDDLDVDDDKQYRFKEVYRTSASESIREFEVNFSEASAYHFNNKNEMNKWVDHFHDLLNKIFIYDPEERITPQEAIRHPFFELVEKKRSFIQKIFGRLLK